MLKLRVFMLVFAMTIFCVLDIPGVYWEPGTGQAWFECPEEGFCEKVVQVKRFGPACDNQLSSGRNINNEILGYY